MKRITLFVVTMLMLVACNRSERQYQVIVSTLDTSAPLELDNIVKARNMIMDASGLDSVQTANLQELFVNYLIACADVQASMMQEAYGAALNITDATKSAEQIDALDSTMQNLRQYGILMYSSEGGIETQIMPLYVAEAFWKYLSPSEQKLSELSELELEAPSLVDAGLAISLDEVAQRLKMCDDMLAEFPNDQLTPQIEECRKYYWSILMVGEDNTPIFDWDTGTLMPEIQQILEVYIETYPETTSAEVMQQFLDIAAKHDYKSSDELNEFIHKTIL